MVKKANCFKVINWIAAFFQITFQLSNFPLAFASNEIPDKTQLIQNQIATEPVTSNAVVETSEQPIVDSTINFLQNSAPFTQPDSNLENKNESNIFTR